MRRRKVVGLLLLLLLVGLVGVPGWLTYRQMRQDRLDRDLVAAIKRGNTPAALSLLAQGADPNAQDETTLKPMSVWARLMDTFRHRFSSSSTAPNALLLSLEPMWERVYPPEDVPLVKALLEHGVRVNVEDSEGNTPLLLATKWGHYDIVQLLLAHRADVNKPDTHGNTPLIIAARNYPGLVSCLLDHGADVNAQGAEGWTAIMGVIDFGSVEAVAALLKHHADVNIKNQDGVSPWSKACNGSSKTIIQLLKQVGAKQ